MTRNALLNNQPWQQNVTQLAMARQTDPATMFGYLLGNKFLRQPLNNLLDKWFPAPQKPTVADKWGSQVKNAIEKTEILRNGSV